MGRMQRLSFTDAKAAVSCFPPKMAAIAALGVSCGCRIAEILQLRVGDVFNEFGDFRNPVRFPKLKTKKGRFGRKEKFASDWRDLPVPDSWQPLIRRHYNREIMRGHGGQEEYLFRGSHGRALSYDTVYNFFRAQLGPYHGTHWMRKTFAFEMYEYYKGKGYDTLNAARLVQKLLGHARLDTTLAYLGFEEAQINADLNAVFNR
jgi:integrase